MNSSGSEGKQAMKCPRCSFENMDDSRFCRSCGTRLSGAGEVSITRTMVEGPGEPAVGDLIAGKYRIVDELGAGGMGIVYKATDTKLKRTVALKFLPPGLARNPEAKKRFIREAQAAAGLDHPNICTIHEAEEAEGMAYIAMAYVEGRTLREKIVQHPLSLEQTVEIIIQAAEGLAVAHKKGIVHRDIKSGNIMVKDDGQAKIMDFGLAKVTGETLITTDAKTMGTVAYMSPEQARGEAVDHRTDIWALGVVFYELLTGRLPFWGERETSILYAIVHEEPKPVSREKPAVPAEIQRIIGRALRKDRESRYASAGEMLEDLRQFQDTLRAEEAGVFNLRSLLRRLRRPRVAIPAAAILIVLGLLAFWFLNRQAKIRWAENTALPEIKKLIDEGYYPNDWKKMTQAFDLAREAQRYIPRDPKFLELWSQCSWPISIRTDSPGAKVYVKPYAFPDEEWRFLGVSPLENVPFPMAFFRWKLEKEGHETVYAVSCTATWTPQSGLKPLDIVRILNKKETIPPDMVRIPGWDEPNRKTPDFFIDKYEVTNRRFKEFVNAGGYQKKEYWKHEFIKEGKTLTWEEARAEFRDAMGRPGPATWQAGGYPDGQDDYPVTGVSWYEAAAYAEYAGKSLPTISHWWRASGMDVGLTRIIFPSLLIPLSNLGGDRPEPVGLRQDLTAYGAYDMAGNVREWCSNETEDGRCLRGGSWGDVANLFQVVSRASPFDRSPQNGFRCVIYLDKETIQDWVFRPIRRDFRDFYSEKPVSDEVFQIYKDQFAYDKKDLAPEVEETDSSAESWVKQRVTFTSAYDNDRLIAYLYLPKNAVPPYQTLIVIPGAAAFYEPYSRNLEKDIVFRAWRYLIKDGRALVLPIYIGTYERKKGFTPEIMSGNESHQYVEHLTKLVKDFRRTIDYLETRPDIDSTRIAYYGFSWGGWLACIIPAVEDRLRLNIVGIGGFPNRGVRPEVSEINYVTRIKNPTLMLNGKYDLLFPYKTNAKPMFDLLGTPEKDKKQVLFESDHNIPATEEAKVVLPWLDRYFGPPKRK